MHSPRRGRREAFRFSPCRARRSAQPSGLVGLVDGPKARGFVHRRLLHVASQLRRRVRSGPPREVGVWFPVVPTPLMLHFAPPNRSRIPRTISDNSRSSTVLLSLHRLHGSANAPRTSSRPYERQERPRLLASRRRSKSFERCRHWERLCAHQISVAPLWPEALRSPYPSALWEPHLLSRAHCRQRQLSPSTQSRRRSSLSPRTACIYLGVSDAVLSSRAMTMETGPVSQPTRSRAEIVSLGPDGISSGEDAGMVS